MSQAAGYSFAPESDSDLSQSILACYIRAMRKLVAIGFLSILFAVPSFAEQHKVTHPKGVHPVNPYLVHPNHKALRGRHKKI